MHNIYDLICYNFPKECTYHTRNTIEDHFRMKRYVSLCILKSKSCLAPKIYLNDNNNYWEIGYLQNTDILLKILKNDLIVIEEIDGEACKIE